MTTTTDHDIRDGYRRLERRGIPPKDIPRLLGVEPLEDTPALAAAKAWLADREARILVMAGPRGVGKTTAGAWCVAQDGRYRDPAEIDLDDEMEIRNRRALYDHWAARSGPRFMPVAKLARCSRYKAEDMEPLETCSLLVIDDLGIEYLDQGGSFLATFDGLFDARYARRLRTAITTNCNAKSFGERYGPRVIDRIREDGRFIELAGESMRGQR